MLDRLLYHDRARAIREISIALNAAVASRFTEVNEQKVCGSAYPGELASVAQLRERRLRK